MVYSNKQFMEWSMDLEHMSFQQVGYLRWNRKAVLVSSTEDLCGWAQLTCLEQSSALSLKILQESTMGTRII
jgi:hypothetical protein